MKERNYVLSYGNEEIICFKAKNWEEAKENVWNYLDLQEDEGDLEDE